MSEAKHDRRLARRRERHLRRAEGKHLRAAVRAAEGVSRDFVGETGRCDEKGICGAENEGEE